MSDIKIPDWLRGHLQDGETVLAKVSIGMSDVYATDSRLIRFSGKSRSEVLEYDTVSVRFEKFGGIWHVARAVLILTGLLAFAIPFLSGMEPPTLVCLFFGPLGVIAGLTYRYGYYQIDSPEFDSRDRRRWRVGRLRWGAGSVERFARIVEERCGGRAG